MNLNQYAAIVHEANSKWWHDLETGERLDRNKGEMIALMHSELSEALEAFARAPWMTSCLIADGRG